MRGAFRYSGGPFIGRGFSGGNMVAEPDGARPPPPPPPVWDTVAGSLGDFAEGVGLSTSVAATDPTDRPLKYTLFDGSLPAGVILALDGTFSGSPADDIEVDTDYEFTVRVSNGRTSSTRVFEITVLYNAPPVWVTDAGSLGGFPEGEAISIAVEATDPEEEDIVYALVSGAFPDGVTLNTATGAITGTPTPDVSEDTEYEVVISASDGVKTVERTFTMVLEYFNFGPTWVTAAGAIAGDYYEGIPLEITFSATDPESHPLTYTLDVTSDTPDNLTLSTAGVLSGTPGGDLEEDTEYDLVINVTDGNTSVQRTFTLTLQVNEPLTWVTDAGELGSSTEGEPISYEVEVSDPENATIVFELTDGTLPTGVTFDNGVFSGTPVAVAGDTIYTLTITAFDGKTEIERIFTFEVLDNPAPVWDTTAGLLDTVDETDAVNVSVSATDPEDETVTYSITDGALPVGVTLNTSTGAITGTPASVAMDTTYDFVVTASDGYNHVPRAFWIIIENNDAPVWGTTAGSIGSVVEGTEVDFELAATDAESDSLTFAITAGALPSGVSLNTSTGAITGTAPGVDTDTTYNFTVTVTDGNTSPVSRAFSMVVAYNDPPVWVTGAGSLGTRVESFAISGLSVSATDPEEEDITYGIQSGALPSGVSLNTSTGAITGTPAEVSEDTTYNFTIRASDPAGNYADRAFSLIVSNNTAPVWDTTAGSLGSRQEGLSFSDITVEATDAEGHTVSYAVQSGALPTGVSLNSSTGVISGIAADVGENTDYNFTIRASDPYGKYTDRAFSMTVLYNDPPTWVTAAGDLGSFLEGTSVGSSITLEATDPEDGDVTYAVQSGSLPSGLSLNTATGAITGTIGDIGSDATANFTIRASDSDDNHTDRSFSITALYNDPPAWDTTAGSLGSFPELVSVGSSINVLAEDPEGGDVTYAVQSGSLPAGLSLNSSTGAITGTPSDVGSDTLATFTIRASDADGNYSDREFTINVLYNDPPSWVTASGSLGTITTGDSLNVSVSATDPEAGAVTYAVQSGALPSGASLNTSSGAITGTISGTGVANFTIRASDADGNYTDRAFSVTVEDDAISDVIIPTGLTISNILVRIPANGSKVKDTGTNSLTEVGTITLNADDGVGDSGYLSGFSSSNYYTTGANDYPTTDSSDRTFMCWYRGAATTTTGAGTFYHPAIVCWGADGSNAGMGLGVDNGKICLANGTVTRGSTNVADGEWHHLAWVKDGTTWTMYVDGVAQGSSFTAALAPYYFRRFGYGYPYGYVTSPSNIDTIAVWDVAMTSGQVAESAGL